MVAPFNGRIFHATAAALLLSVAVEADELLATTPNFGGGGPQVVITCDDDVAVALEDSSRRMASANMTGISSASVSGIAALEDTSVNMSIE